MHGHRALLLRRAPRVELDAAALQRAHWRRRRVVERIFERHRPRARLRRPATDGTHGADPAALLECILVVVGILELVVCARAMPATPAAAAVASCEAHHEHAQR